LTELKKESDCFKKERDNAIKERAEVEELLTAQVEKNSELEAELKKQEERCTCSTASSPSVARN
jgi:septal ring factor EnvC (AmiA/AmiB activator)